MVEGGRIAQCFEESGPILEMRLHVADLRVEDVRQGAAPQEDLTHYAHTLRIFIGRPHCPEAHHGRQLRLQFRQLL